MSDVDKHAHDDRQHVREYTLQEAAAELSYSVRTLQRAMADGRLDFQRVGSRGVRFRPEHLAAFRESIRTQRLK